MDSFDRGGFGRRTWQKERGGRKVPKEGENGSVADVQKKVAARRDVDERFSRWRRALVKVGATKVETSAFQGGSKPASEEGCGGGVSSSECTAGGRRPSIM